MPEVYIKGGSSEVGFWTKKQMNKVEERGICSLIEQNNELIERLLENQRYLNEYLRNMSFQRGDDVAESVYVVQDLEEDVTCIMKKLGMPANLLGYVYTRTAIMMSVEKPETLQSVTKALYPEIARQYRTTSSRVERAIRHAIEVAWTRCCLEEANDIFGYSVSERKSKPTNSEFIAMIADKIRLKRK